MPHIRPSLTWFQAVALNRIGESSETRDPVVEGLESRRQGQRNMVEPTVAFTLFDRTLSVLGLIRDRKKQRTEQTDQALLTLYAALAETRSYLSDLQAGKPRDKERQFAIARLWNTASVPLREIDKDLSERCFLKGGYWMEPEA